MKLLIGILIVSTYWQSFASLKLEDIGDPPPQNSEQTIASCDNPIDRRIAFRKLLKASDGETVAKKYLNDIDPLIRKAALYFLIDHLGDQSIDLMISAIADDDSSVRMLALSGLTPYYANENVQSVIQNIEQNDPDQALRKHAARINWPFNRENRLLKDDPSWDHELVKLKSIELPQENWKFITDPNANGHHQKYFDPAFDDSSWKFIKMGHWETQGWPDYDGIAWYRMPFKMLDKMDSNAVEFLFEAVDESAWVWLNGIYLGKHDIGAAGWNTPFRLDATAEIKWGEENILVVRVLDTTMAGGIWKPINMEIFK